MSIHYARPLSDTMHAQNFLVTALGLPDSRETGDKAMKVSEAETLISSKNFRSTLIYPNNRHPSYATEETRRILRERIFEELITLNRLPSDEDICLGIGGAIPMAGSPLNDKIVLFITGLPASGKSFIASRVAEHYKGVILDSDYAKRKFPEYQRTYSASLLHDESTRVVFGDEESQRNGEFCVLEYCLANGYSMVIPKIGHNMESIEVLRDQLIEKGYEPHLTLVSLDRKKATIRALNRYHITGRYVPLSLIFDGYSNDPILSYYRMRNCEKWKSIGKISTDVPLGDDPKVVECSEGNPAGIFGR